MIKSTLDMHPPASSFPLDNNSRISSGESTYSSLVFPNQVSHYLCSDESQYCPHLTHIPPSPYPGFRLIWVYVIGVRAAA